MKSIFLILLTVVLCFTLVACEETDNHIGEAKTPSGSSVMRGRNYQDVIKVFEDNGFTNIITEQIQDLITGWITKDGEVEKVSVGGDENYSADKWVLSDIEVVIYYHTFPTDKSISENDDTFQETKDNNANVEETVIEQKIVMPYSSSDYCGEEWTVEELTDHLEELGFTNINTYACAPDDDRYKSNIFEICIKTGWFSTGPWNAGEEYSQNAEISVYYNEFPLLTVENCPDLVTVLTSKDMSYMSFAKAYDGRYVEFDAYVTNHIVYDGGTSHIIDVTGGDYDGVRELEDYDDSTYDGLVIRIGDRAWRSPINNGVKAGDSVRVSGRIDASWCEYFKQLYVETILLERR